MRLGVDARTLVRPTTGVGSYLASLLSHLGRLMAADQVVLFHDSPAGLVQTFGPALEEVYVWSPLVRQKAGANVGAALWLNCALPRAIRARQIDTMFCPNFFVPAAAARKVAVVHDIAPLLQPPGHYARAWLAYFRFMLPRSLKFADAIITPSETVRTALISHLSIVPEKVTAIPHGVSHSYFQHIPDGILAAVRAKYGIGESAVLSVGQNNHRKNLIVLAAAVALLRQRGMKNLQLIVCGSEGSASAEVDREIERLGLAEAVIRTGQVPLSELRCLYRLASVFAMPSFDEGFGLPVIEAMASGTPVLISDRGSLPEVAGGAAPALDPGDPDAWASAIARLLSDGPLRSERTELGLNRAREFPWERTAARTLAVLRGDVVTTIERRRVA